VEERAEEEAATIAHLGERLALHGIILRPDAPQDRAHLPEGTGEVGVHREPVVGIALGPAPHLAPAREEQFEYPEAVQRLEARDARIAGFEEPEERLA
jgi:hypothetical protein